MGALLSIIRRRTPLLFALPDELLLHIAEFLPFSSLRCLSLTNSYLHGFLVPVMFKSLRATNYDHDMSILEKIVAKHGHHVKKLVFDCHLSLWERKGPLLANAPPTEQTAQLCSLPEFSIQLLSGQHLPGLQTVRITFFSTQELCGNGWQNGYPGSIHDLQNSESLADCARPEQVYRWRFIMAGVFSAVANNPSVRKLELCKLLPKPSSTFSTHQWREFLGRLEELDIEMWGARNRNGIRSNAAPGYRIFVHDLNDYIFKHIKAVKRLRIAADPHNPIAVKIHANFFPLPLQTHDVPHLQRLEVENCALDRALVALIEARANQLTALSLTNCFSCWQEDRPDSAIVWAHFFASIRAAAPVQLRTFAVINTLKEFNPAARELGEAILLKPDDGVAWRERLDDLRERLRANPRSRLWPYQSADNSWGMVMPCARENLLAFAEGSDQREFEALLEVVGENWRRLGGPATMSG